MVATLDDLDEAALVDILTKPKNALVKQYQRLFEMEDVQLEFNDDALQRHRAEGDHAQDRRARPALDHGSDPARTRCSSCPASTASSEMVINKEVVEGPRHSRSTSTRDRRGEGSARTGA